jgi:MFS family permease
MAVSAGNTALTAVLPAIGRELRLPDTVVAGVFSLSAVLWAVTAPIWARLSDKRGRKPLIQLGLLGFGISMASFGLVVQAGLSGWIGAGAVFIGLMLTRGCSASWAQLPTPPPKPMWPTGRRRRSGPPRWP